MKTNFIALFSGILFGMGLSLAHMVNPNKVLNFLDIAGNWDPSLLFVMIGALSISLVTFRFNFKRSAPLWADTFDLPKKRALDLKLITGATIFGIGWGFSGLCPGPSVTGLGLFSVESIIMVIALYLGFIACQPFMNKK